MRLTAEKKEEKRARIMEAGLDLMKLNGYHGTSVKDITDRAGIPKGSFFNYFESKESFTEEIIRVYSDEAAENASSVLLNKRMSPINRIKKFYKSNIEFLTQELNYKEGCFINTMCQEMSDVSKDISRTLFDKIDEFRQPLIQCIQEGQNNGSISETYKAADLATFIDNAFRGTSMVAKSDQRKRPYEIFNKIISDLLKPK